MTGDAEGAWPVTTAVEVARVVAWLESEGAVYQVNGGWGVDALVGHQTRPHRDLDLFLDEALVEELLTWLHGRGYAITEDWRPVRVELSGPHGRVDVHPLRLDEQGNGIQQGLHGQTYRHDAGDRAVGAVHGRGIVVATARRARELRQGYPARPQDVHDVAHLDRLIAAEQQG